MNYGKDFAGCLVFDKSQDLCGDTVRCVLCFVGLFPLAVFGIMGDLFSITMVFQDHPVKKWTLVVVVWVAADFCAVLATWQANLQLCENTP